MINILISSEYIFFADILLICNARAREYGRFI